MKKRMKKRINLRLSMKRMNNKDGNNFYYLFLIKLECKVKRKDKKCRKNKK